MADPHQPDDATGHRLGAALRDTKIRLHALDALRGLAALAVVLWHWQHFQLLGTSRLTWASTATGLDHTHQPFFRVVGLFYDYGYMAVDLFFLISGFIFFWLYTEKITEGSLSILDFWMLRITRLYPLHLATLVVVLVLQLLFWRQTGQYFVYSANSFSDFLKSLLFFQVNGEHAAFNGPTWSLTIELVMYGVFCIVAWTGMLKSAIAPTSIFFIGLALYARHPNVAMGFCGFFEGGLVYQIFLRLQRSPLRREFFLATMIACAGGWFIVLADNHLHNPAFYTLLESIMSVNGMSSRHLVIYMLFPLTILLLAMHESLTSFKYEYLAWLGEISYSSYLVHFPLQIIFALAIVWQLVRIPAAGSGIFLLVYVSVLIFISLGINRFFEVPIQRLLRQIWGNLMSRKVNGIGNAPSTRHRHGRRQI